MFSLLIVSRLQEQRTSVNAFSLFSLNKISILIITDKTKWLCTTHLEIGVMDPKTGLPKNHKMLPGAIILYP